LYVVRTPFRDSLRKTLHDSGIGSGIHYPVPVHLQPAYRGRVPTAVGGLAVSEALAREVLSLPMHPFLSARDLDRVVGAVRNWLESGRGREA
jgi:dTDP-4-amino-4,6-dideoxygalactose transaminase